MEQWKEIEGNRETYAVSDQGEVKTVTRPGARGSTVKGHALAQRENSNGYLRVTARFKGEKKSYAHFVHRLVAEAFVPNPENKPFVNHKDGNKHNNHATNLEWCTKSENEKHAWRTGLKTDVATKGELHGMHKLKEKDVKYIRKNHVRNGGELKTGDLARMFSVNPQTITEIVSKRVWKSVL